MSRVLDRATGSGSTQPRLRPRLPTLFEPGLDLRPALPDTGPSPMTADHGRPAAVTSAAAGPGVPESPAFRGLPPVTASPDGPAAGWPRPGAGLSAAQAPPGTGTPWPGGFGFGGPGGADDPDLPISGGRAWSHPVRPPRMPATGDIRPAVNARPGPAAQPATDTVPVVPAGRRKRPPAAAIRPAPHREHVEQASDVSLAHSAAHDRDSDAGPDSPARAGTVSAAPVIRIEIGRVEVRADRAAGHEPAQPRSERSAGRRQSAPELAEYLKRRGGRP